MVMEVHERGQAEPPRYYCYSLAGLVSQLVGAPLRSYLDAGAGSGSEDSYKTESRWGV